MQDYFDATAVGSVICVSFLNFQRNCRMLLSFVITSEKACFLKPLLVSILLYYQQCPLKDQHHAQNFQLPSFLAEVGVLKSQDSRAQQFYVIHLRRE